MSGIRAKLAREEDLLGNVTPYLVRKLASFSVCRLLVKLIRALHIS